MAKIIITLEDRREDNGTPSISETVPDIRGGLPGVVAWY